MEEEASRPSRVLDRLVIRLVRSVERARWRELMNVHHYLGFRPIVGESLW
jgi:hypothetical protein